MADCPKFRSQPWSRLAPSLDPVGQDLLARMLAYDPACRISAAATLAHPYFSDVAQPHGSLDDDVTAWVQYQQLQRAAAAAQAGASAQAPSVAPRGY